MATDSLPVNDTLSTLQAMGYSEHYINRAFTVYKKLNNKRDTAFQLSLLVEIIDRLKHKDKQKKQQLHQNQAKTRHHLQSVHHPPPQHRNYPQHVQKPQSQPPPAPKHVQKPIHQHHHNHHSPHMHHAQQPQPPPAHIASSSPPPFIPHYQSAEDTLHLNVNDCVDYRYENGRYILCRILSKTVNYNGHTVLLLHPEGTPLTENRYDRYCDLYGEYHKLAAAKSITLRTIRDKHHALKHVKLDDYIDVNPLYRSGHIGWKHGKVIKLDAASSQIKVLYVLPATDNNEPYSYWLHLENKMEAAPYKSRCRQAAQQNDADEGCQSGEEYDVQFASPAMDDAYAQNVMLSNSVSPVTALDILDDHSPQNVHHHLANHQYSNSEKHVAVSPNVRLSQPNMYKGSVAQQEDIEPRNNSRSIFAQLDNGSFLAAENEQKSAAVDHGEDEHDEEQKKEEILRQLQAFGYPPKEIESAMKHTSNALDINQVMEYLNKHEMDNIVQDVDDAKDEQVDEEQDEEEESAPQIERAVTGTEFDSELKTMATGNDLMIDDIISEMDEDSDMKEDHISPYVTPMGGPPVNHLNIGEPLNPISPNKKPEQVQTGTHYSDAQREWMAKYAQETPSGDAKQSVLALVCPPNDDEEHKDEQKRNMYNDAHLKPRSSGKRKSLRTRLQGQILNEQFSDKSAGNSKARKKKKSSVFGQKSLKSAGGGKERVFGVDGISLSSTLILDKDYNAPIPNILIKLKEELFAHNGHLMEGIFRISPKAEQYQKIENRLDKGEIFEIDFDELGCELIASLIKIWFRKLPHGILDDIIHKIGDGEKCTNAQFVAQIIENDMNEPMQSYYKWVLDLCLEVVKYENVNKMSMRAMAVVIAPNLYDVEKMKKKNSAQNAIHVSNVMVQFVELSILWRHLQEKSSANVVDIE